MKAGLWLLRTSPSGEEMEDIAKRIEVAKEQLVKMRAVLAWVLITVRADESCGYAAM